LIFLTALAVVVAFAAYLFLIKRTEIQSVLVAYAGLSIVCLATYLAAVTWIERRLPAEFSLRNALPVCAAGFVAAVALFSLVMAILWIAGVYQPQGLNAFDSLGIGSAFLFWLAVGAQEEILYRGLLFRLFSKVVGTWGALLLSAAIFGALHGTNPGATIPGLLSTALAGVLLGAAYALTGRLWLPIGLHAGWNFAEGAVFGTLVSGNDVGGGMISGTLNGPVTLTGGRFGPEASVVAVVLLVACTAVLLWRIARLRRTEPPIWSGAPGSPAVLADANAGTENGIPQGTRPG
jgi:membrane protease YdiL (CAAX protease family)